VGAELAGRPRWGRWTAISPPSRPTVWRDRPRRARLTRAEVGRHCWLCGGLWWFTHWARKRERCIWVSGASDGEIVDARPPRVVSVYGWGCTRLGVNPTAVGGRARQICLICTGSQCGRSRARVSRVRVASRYDFAQSRRQIPNSDRERFGPPYCPSYTLHVRGTVPTCARDSRAHARLFAVRSRSRLRLQGGTRTAGWTERGDALAAGAGRGRC